MPGVSPYLGKRVHQQDSPHYKIKEECKKKIRTLIFQKSTILSQSKKDDRITCPITYDYPREPVATNCGHIYDKRHLEAWLRKKSNCAVCWKVIRGDPFPLPYLKKAIESWEKEDVIVPSESLFKKKEENVKIAQGYLESAKICIEEQDYKGAIEAYRNAFIHKRNIGLEHYSRIPELYHQIHAKDKAVLATLHLTLYQIEAGQVRGAVDSLKRINSKDLDVCDLINHLTPLISQVTGKNPQTLLLHEVTFSENQRVYPPRRKGGYPKRIQAPVAKSIALVKSVIERQKIEILQEYPYIGMFKCPLTKKTPQDPIVASCGHIYDASAYNIWKASSATKDLQCQSKGCNKKIDRVSQPITALRDFIQEREREEDSLLTFNLFKKTNPKLAQQYLKNAKICIEGGDFEGALEACKNTLFYTQDPADYSLIPDLYQKLGKEKQAIVAYLYWGLYQLEEGKIDTAIGIIKKISSSSEDIQKVLTDLKILRSRLQRGSTFIEEIVEGFRLTMSEENWIDPKTINHFPEYPQELTEFLSSPCPYWRGKKRSATHFVFPLFPTVSIGGEVMKRSLNSLEALNTLANEESYQMVSPSISKEDTAEGGFYWGVMTKFSIPGSSNRLFDTQRKMVREHEDEVPTILDVVTGLFWAKRYSNTLFYQAPHPQKVQSIDGSWGETGEMYWEEYTICKEEELQTHFGVGNFNKRGLSIVPVGMSDRVGVAAFRKFKA